MNALPELTRSRCVLLSDFNVRNLAGYLRRDAALSNWDVQETDFGQVMPLLLDATHEVWQRPGDLAVVWTLPQVLQSYEELLDGHGAGLDRILSEVDDFAGLVAGLATRVRTVLVPTWTQDPSSRGLGVLDLRPGGHAHALLRMNQRLADRLAEHSNVFVVDASRWLRLDKDSVSPKHWYFSKTPFGLSVFSQAAQEIRALVDAVEGRAKKLLILDLDNTLWGGIVGDCGWPNIGLGGHDAAGEAYKDFQRALKSLQRRGIILGLVSKNDEKVALEAIDRHPEMVLRRDDFAGWRINWEDKATNILELVRELNLGADAAVFIDDNPAERGRVAAAVPQIFVPSWPTDPLEYRRALEALSCFDTVSISEEDRNRTRSYVAQRRLANERRRSVSGSG
jgi:HAD superfamily phosphatase (TIGR01681 family)